MCLRPLRSQSPARLQPRHRSAPGSQPHAISLSVHQPYPPWLIAYAPNMEVLDEKTNGGPTMEVDEIVSVRDGTPHIHPVSPTSSPRPSRYQRRLLPPNICRIWAMMSKTSRSSTGGSPTGRSSTRNSQVQTSSVAGTNGTSYDLWFHHRIEQAYKGGYCFSPLAIPTPRQMIPSPYISTTRIQRVRPKDGMPVPNSRSLSPTFTTPQSIPLAVSARLTSHAQVIHHRFRRAPSIYRRGMRLGLYSLQRTAQTLQRCRKPDKANNRG